MSEPRVSNSANNAEQRASNSGPVKLPPTNAKEVDIDLSPGSAHRPAATIDEVLESLDKNDRAILHNLTELGERVALSATFKVLENAARADIESAKAQDTARELLKNSLSELDTELASITEAKKQNEKRARQISDILVPLQKSFVTT